MEERIIALEDNEYPQLLKKISDPPKKLYVKGRLSSQEKCVAVVGTRTYSGYGKEATWYLTGELARAGLTIVSGLAPGIDTFAHEAALDQGARTIAVLGTGLDEKSMYPKENLTLARKMLETGGALVSEYPPGTRGSKFTFPKRNRIISGMCLGVLVVEAREKSGSLITATYAKEQKRKLFAVPGSIFSSVSQGIFWAIKKLNAIPVHNAQDILAALDMPIDQHISISKYRHDYISDKARAEALIVKALAQGNCHVEEIIEKTGLPAQKVASALAMLEMEGEVKNLGGNSYAVTHR